MANQAEKAFQLRVIRKGCCVPNCGPANDFHHVSRGTEINQKGGTQPKPGARRDEYYGVGFCRKHHMAFHDQEGNIDNFYENYGVNLELEADYNYEVLK